MKSAALNRRQRKNVMKQIRRRLFVFILRLKVTNAFEMRRAVKTSSDD